jgi:CRP/FNR family transcriptional regulator, cyclic AMP receptor protein
MLAQPVLAPGSWSSTFERNGRSHDIAGPDRRPATLLRPFCYNGPLRPLPNERPSPMSERPRKSLAAIVLLKGLPAAALSELAAACAWRTRAAGEAIIRSEDRTDDVYFLVDGRVRAVIYSAEGHIISLRDLVAGDTFGELAAIDGKARSASIEAVTACTCASLSGARFRALVAAQPVLALALLRRSVLLVRSLTDRVVEYSTLSVPNRVHAELLRLALAAGPRANNATLPRLTHAELASRISTHREAVTRELRKLAKLGIVASRGRTLTVLDLARLQQLVNVASGHA